MRAGLVHCRLDYRRGASLLALLALGVMIHCASASKQPPAQHRPDGGDAAVGSGGFCEGCVLGDDGAGVGLSRSSEISGIAGSAVHAGVYYLHNDSGDEPRFFAVDDTGTLRGTFRVKGAIARDWEDIAVGPCGTKSCVFLGDVGDNDARRTDTVVYRVPEPDVLDVGVVDVEGEAIPFRYPDGSHDCEALLVHPKTGRLVVVTKEKTSPSGVYAFPETLAAGKSVTLTRAADVKLPDGSPLVTGGDVHPQGRGLLLRTYSRAFYFAGQPDDTIEDMLKSSPCAVPAATEAQGEAIAWMRSGQGWVTVSEGEPTLHPVRCGGS